MSSTAVLTREQQDFYGLMRLAAVSTNGQPFIRVQIFHLIPIASTKTQFAKVDRHSRVYLNFDRLMELGVEYASKILIHEAWHVLRSHADRSKSTPLNYSHAMNVACDMEINDDIKGLPPFAVFPSSYGQEDHLSAEEYFDLIKDRVGPNQGESDDDEGSGDSDKGGDSSPKCGSGGGDKSDTEDELPPEEAPTRSDAQQQVTRIRVAEDILREGAKVGIGTGSGNSILEWARKTRYPRTPWQHVLRVGLTRAVEYQMGNTEISWGRRSIISDSVPDAVIPGDVQPIIRVGGVADTSSSNIPNLDLVLAEIDNILRKLGITEMVAMTVDTEASQPKIIRRASQLSMIGGGGTDMGIGIKALSELRGNMRIDVGIIFTDGYTGWPTEKPRGKQSWIVCLLPIGGIISEHVKKAVPSWAKVVEVIE